MLPLPKVIDPAPLNEAIVTATYPNLPLVWLDTDGGSDFVFLIDQASLQTLI